MKWGVRKRFAKILQSEALRAWTSRLIISLVPVIVSLVSIAIGNSWLDAAGEGSATFAYLLVLIGSENVVMSASEREEGSSEPVMWEVMLVILAMVLWMLLIFIRVQARVASLSEPPVSLYAVAIVSVILSFLVLKPHSRHYGHKFEYERLIKQNRHRQEEAVEGNPSKVRMTDGTEINLANAAEGKMTNVTETKHE